MSEIHSETVPVTPWGSHAPALGMARWLGFLHRLPPGPFWRRIALWLRGPCKHMLPQWVDLTVWGLRLRLRGTGNLSEQRLITMPQYLDPIERQTLARVLPEDGIFLDIGANAGVYSLWAASLGKRPLRIEAFEPDPELCASLRFNLASNGLEACVHLHEVAVGPEEGSVRLMSEEGNKGENHIGGVSAGDEKAEGGGLMVPMITLPGFLQRESIPRIDALKIDIEGHECGALRPLFEQCPRSVWPRWLICEVVHDEDDELAGLLRSHGYRLRDRGRLNGIYALETP